MVPDPRDVEDEELVAHVLLEGADDKTWSNYGLEDIVLDTIVEDETDEFFCSVLDEYNRILLDDYPSDPEKSDPLDYEPRISTMQVANTPAPEVMRSSTTPVWPMGDRPRYESADTYCLSAYVTINGLQALALFDSGSTNISITPDFVRVARVPLVTLKNSVWVQLGCVGSRSSITYGAHVNLEYAIVREEVYVDIVNIERYNMIIGVPWMYRHGASLDFKHQSIVIDRQSMPVLSLGEEASTVSRRAARRRDRCKRIASTSSTG